MSQVNDALKRVRDTQQTAPRPAELPQLRPPTHASATQPTRGVGLMLPIIFIAVALLALSLFLQLRQRQIVSARQPVAAVKPAPTPTQVASATIPNPALPHPANAGVPPANGVAHEASASASAGSVPATLAPPAPVIKLQGILYAGHNSTAMISGQTVTAGDEIGGYRVAAIGQRSVTLVCASRTNVLSLGR